jgi:hypothetical protein
VELRLALSPKPAITSSSYTTYRLYIAVFSWIDFASPNFNYTPTVFEGIFHSISLSLLCDINIFITMSNVACNYTILQQDCTLQTCCLNQGTVDYIPTLAGNITYATIFVLLLGLQLSLCLWYRMWTFMVGMVCGLLCEIIGYAGRIWMHYSIFDMNPFLM